MVSITSVKDKIRKRILTFLRKQKEEDRQKKSLSILKKLFAAAEFKRARTVLFYASFDGEVDTFEMMKRSLKLGKKIALPTLNTKKKEIIPVSIKNLQKDLKPGAHGILEPCKEAGEVLDLLNIDLSVVPGIAFDRNNFRLGRGAGYYDRFLARLSRNTPSVGLAFDFQIVATLPRQSHDLAVTRVIVN